jgi:hypothetical protein
MAADLHSFGIVALLVCNAPYARALTARIGHAAEATGHFWTSRASLFRERSASADGRAALEHEADGVAHHRSTRDPATCACVPGAIVNGRDGFRDIVNDLVDDVSEVVVAVDGLPRDMCADVGCAHPRA